MKTLEIIKNLERVLAENGISVSSSEESRRANQTYVNEVIFNESRILVLENMMEVSNEQTFCAW